MLKKKTRRGERERHPILIQYAKVMSKTQDERKVSAHIKCFKYEDMGHFLPQDVLSILRRRVKQLMRGKTMRSTT
jgi:hypothetical protein